MAKRKGERTLADHLVETVGFRAGIHVVAMVAAWGEFMEAEGRPPRNVDEYAVWHRQSSSKAYRELLFFRQAFPDYEFPTELWLRIRHRATAKSTEARALQLGGVAVP